MTIMDLPSFLFELLDQEWKKMQEELLVKVAKHYHIDSEEIVKKFVEPLKILPEKAEKVVICRKQKTRKIPLDECRCMARIWNRGKGGQCTRSRCDNSEYCTQHIEKRKHGNILDPPSKEVFHHKTRILYK